MDDCSSLDEIRRRIDELDERIIELLCARSRYVRAAARLKTCRADIVDERRIAFIIERARRLAEEGGADPVLLERIYRSSLDAFIEYEAAEHDRFHSSR